LKIDRQYNGQKKRGVAGMSFTGLTPPHVCGCPKQGYGFSTYCVVVVFVFR